ncbi:MAG: acyl-CoA mutase large subunit family protein, partial [Candidatus Dormibacteraeota bacterium]|nr:acyl-CoA mutase large subunit family protein [Candidatus Dormibacteraeota bacterium]
MTEQVVNDSGVVLEPYYGQPAPGEFPFTRGIRADMYRQRLWTMRQYAGFGTA